MNCKPSEDRYFHPKAAREARKKALVDAAGRVSGLTWCRAWAVILWARVKAWIFRI